MNHYYAIILSTTHHTPALPYTRDESVVYSDQSTSLSRSAQPRRALASTIEFRTTTPVTPPALLGIPKISDGFIKSNSYFLALFATREKLYKLSFAGFRYRKRSLRVLCMYLSHYSGVLELRGVRHFGGLNHQELQQYTHILPRGTSISNRHFCIKGTTDVEQQKRRKDTECINLYTLPVVKP